MYVRIQPPMKPRDEQPFRFPPAPPDTPSPPETARFRKSAPNREEREKGEV